MGENLIDQAFQQMVADIPVRPHEIHNLVAKVNNEVVAAANLHGEKRNDESSKTMQLLPGMVLTQPQRSESQDGTCRSHFELITKTDQGDHSTTFSARAGLDQVPAISDPQNSGNVVLWKEKNGPQKPWIVESLRKQVADFFTSRKG